MPLDRVKKVIIFGAVWFWSCFGVCVFKNMPQPQSGRSWVGGWDGSAEGPLSSGLLDVIEFHHPHLSHLQLDGCACILKYLPGRWWAMVGDFNNFIFLNFGVFLKGNITSFVFQAQILDTKEKESLHPFNERPGYTPREEDGAYVMLKMLLCFLGYGSGDSVYKQTLNIWIPSSSNKYSLISLKHCLLSVQFVSVSICREIPSSIFPGQLMDEGWVSFQSTSFNMHQVTPR